MYMLKLLIIQFSPIATFLLGPTVLLNIQFSNTQSMFFLSERDQVPQPQNKRLNSMEFEVLA
jgi:hypothetical protein